MFAELIAAAAERLVHFAQDMQAAGFRLIERHAHDLFGDAGDLDVHLQRRDAHFGSRHLEVHVAQMILVPENIGKHGIAAAFENQAHGNACGRTRDRHARIHQSQ